MRAAWVVASAALAASGCLESKSLMCEVGTEHERVCPASSVCDDTHHLCIDAAQRESCNGATDGDRCQYGGSLVTQGLCHDGVCFEERCGDGFISGDEVCEGDNLGAATDCTSIGYYEPSPLSCNAACAYDESKCLGFCGDGIVTAGHELCDGAPPAETCTSFGYGAGFLGCKFCAPDLDACKFFGWHNPVYVSPYLYDLAGRADDDIYAVGIAGMTAAVIHYDGKTWKDVDVSACNFAPYTTLLQVRVAGPSDLWIGTSESGKATVVHLTSTSCTKSQIDVGAGAISGSVYDLVVTAGSDVWALASGGTYRLAGSSWMQADTFGVSPSSRIWAAASNDVYVVSSLQLRHWNGALWSTIFLSDIDAYSVYGTSGSDVWVGGDVNSGYARVVHFDGQTWQHVMPQGTSDTTAVRGRITALSSATGHVVGGDKDGAYFEYDGASWTNLNGPLIYSTPRVWISPTATVYAINQTVAQVQRFGDGIRIDTPTLAGNAAQAFAHRSNAVFAALGSSVYVFDGITWTEENRAQSVADVWVDPATGTLFDLESGGLTRRDAPGSYTVVSAALTGTRLWGTSATDIWVANYSVLRHWSGTLDPACTTCTAPKNLFDLWGTSSTDVFGVGLAGTIYHYDGTNWSTQTSSTAQTLRAVWGWAANDVVAVGDAGTVIHFDGTTWSDLGYPLPHNLLSVWGTSRSDLFTSSAEGYVYRFDGTHWAPVASGSTEQVGAITGSGDSVFWFKSSATSTVYRLLRTVSW